MPQSRYTSDYRDRNADDDWRRSERNDRSRYDRNEGHGYGSASRSYRDEDGSSRAPHERHGRDRDQYRRSENDQHSNRYDEDRYGADVSRSRLESRRSNQDQGWRDDSQRWNAPRGGRADTDDRGSYAATDRSRYGGQNDWVQDSRSRNEGFRDGYAGDWEDSQRPDRHRATHYANQGYGQRSERERGRLHENMPDERHWGSRGAGRRDFYD